MSKDDDVVILDRYIDLISELSLLSVNDDSLGEELLEVVGDDNVILNW